MLDIGHSIIPSSIFGTTERAQFELLVDSLQKNLELVRESRRRLVTAHLYAGRDLVALRDLIFKSAPKHIKDKWLSYVLSNVYVSYEYSIRTAHRDIALWEKLKDEQELLTSTTANDAIAISALYTLVTEDDLTLEMVMRKLESLPEKIRRADRITSSVVRKIGEQSRIISRQAADKRELLEKIVVQHGVMSPSVTEELAHLETQSLETILLTGTLTVTDDWGKIEQIMPVADSSTTDVRLFAGDVALEKMIERAGDRLVQQENRDNTLDQERLPLGSFYCDVLAEDSRILTELLHLIKSFRRVHPDGRLHVKIDGLIDKEKV